MKTHHTPAWNRFVLHQHHSKTRHDGQKQNCIALGGSSLTANHFGAFYYGFYCPTGVQEVLWSSPPLTSQEFTVGPLWNLLLDIATRLSSIAKFEREKNMNPHPHTTEHSWNGPLNPKPWFLGGVFNTVSGGIDEWTSRILHVTPGTGGHCLCCAALRRVWGASWFSTQSRHHEMTQSIGFCSSYARPNRYNLLKTMFDGRACPPLPFLAQTRRLDLPTLKWLDGWCWFEMVMYLSSSWNRRSQTDFVSMFFHQRAVKKSPMDRTEIPIDIHIVLLPANPVSVCQVILHISYLRTEYTNGIFTCPLHLPISSHD